MKKQIVLYSICALFVVVYFIFRTKFLSSINKCLLKKDDTLFEYLNKFYSRYFLTPFYIELTKLKFYMLNKDNNSIDEQINFIEQHMRLTNKQKGIFNEHIFYKYLNDKNYKKCNECLNVIKKSKYVCSDMPYLETIVDIFYKGSNDYLEKLEALYNEIRESNETKKKASIELLIEELKKNN